MMKYGLIGGSLAHSFSPQIHTYLGLPDYELCELKDEELADFFAKRDFLGLNVTIPHKCSVIPYLDALSPTAKTVGAVNTIVNRNGKLIGHNTDFSAMLQLISATNVPLNGKTVLILGTGGTSHTAREAVRPLGATRVIRVGRSVPDLETVPDVLNETDISYADAARYVRDADVIINATPRGMFPNDDEPLCFSFDDFPNLSLFVDAIYHPLRTEAVLQAQERGIRAIGGLYMLVSQAVASEEAFLGRPIPRGKIDKAYRALHTSMENVVLSGMPTAGKTTVGRQIAEDLGRPFFDTDEIFVSRHGPIASFFAAYGEEAFRKIESEIIRELAKINGAVIATGGGCVTIPENVRALRRNGRIYYLDRPLSSLSPSPDRPIASTADAMRALHAVRDPIYRRIADHTVSADSDPAAVAHIIEEDFLNENYRD